MNILLVNKFFYRRGGAEVSFFETAELLKQRGHQVCFFSMQHPRNLATPFDQYFVSRVEFDETSGPLEQLKAAGRLLYSFEARRMLRVLLANEEPQIAHLNNIHHQISPSIIHELQDHKIPIIMTLHDFKLVCPVYSLLRNGHPCEKCSGGKYYQAFVNRCAKNSYLKSALTVGEMYLHHNLLRIYDKIDLLVAPSRFLMEKIRNMGFPRQVEYLPYFVDLDKYTAPMYRRGAKNIVYFGRLSEEKGLFTLCDAMKGLDVALDLIGDGPQEASLKMKVEVEGIRNIHFWGHQDGETLQRLISGCMFVVLPSVWYENYPRTVIESFAMGKPVVGANIGGIPELVKHGETGLLFVPGNSDDLREKIQWLIRNRDAVINMGKKARAFVEEELNAEVHYQRLMQLYDRALLARG